MDRILIIEDDTEIHNMMLEAFTRAGYRCAQAFSGTEALLRMDGGDVDLAVMDLMLPGMSGEQLLPQLKEKQDIPVIVVSAKDGIDTKVGLLESGADDYMTKPFEIRELIARAAVQIRKKNPSGKTGRGLTYGGLSLNEDNYTAEVSGGEIPLTKQEFKILELLMSNPAKVYSKQEIYDYAWDEYYIGEDKTINVHISNIRKKLKKFTDDEYIETVWGIGFRMAKQSV